MLNCNNFLVREKRQKLSRREKDIYGAWLKGKYKKDHLKTLAGEKVSIVSAGRRNELEGPDFFDAMVIVGDELFKGPVEIHLANRDWYEHGHQNDPNYNDVILHVVTQRGNGKKIKTENNRTIPTLILEDYKIENRKQQLCREWKSLDEQKFLQVLEQYGEQRFNRKSLILKSQIIESSLEQVFYAGLLDVLGYSKNRTAFAKLAKTIELDQIYAFWAEYLPEKRIPALEALTLGISGFLKAEKGQYFRQKRYYKEIQELWHNIKAAYEFQVIGDINWHFVKSRPANHPPVRILALVQILNNFYPGQPAQKWMNFLARKPKLDALNQWLQKNLQEPSGLWQNHPLLHKQARKKLLGDKRIMDLLSNYLLPLAKAFGNLTKSPALVKHAEKLAHEIQRGALPGIVKKMFSKVGASTTLIKNNNLLQGSIEFYRNWCNMNLCELCPLREYAN